MQHKLQEYKYQLKEFSKYTPSSEIKNLIKIHRYATIVLKISPAQPQLGETIIHWREQILSWPWNFYSL